MTRLYTTKEKYTAEQLKEMKEKYTITELICCTASRELEDREVVFVGVGISDLAGAIGKLVYAPNAIMVAEAGYVGFAGIQVMASPADNRGGTMAMCHEGFVDIFLDQQSGFIDVAYLGLAQVDKFGNVNTTYVDPTGKQIRMNGSGGGGDISSSAGRIVYTVEFNPRSYVEKLDYMTNPGHLDGYDSREKANLVGGGPSCLVSNRGVLRFEEESKEMYLAEIFPWQDEKDVEEIKKAAPWGLKVAKELKVIEPPTERELWAMRLMDPDGMWTIPNMMDRPIGKVLMAGKFNYEGYDDLMGALEVGWRKAMEFLV